VALNRGHHLCLTGRPSRWALAHILVLLSCFPRLFSAVADWMPTMLPHMSGLSANLECTSEMCCTRIAENTGCKTSPSVHHHTTLSGYIFATKACVNNRKKNLSNSNISSTCPHNMVNFGPLMPEIGCRVCGTPANFNGFRILASLLHRRRSTEVNQTLHDVGRLLGWYTIYIYFRGSC